MYNWTQKVGFPMITITNESYDETKKMMTLDLYQNRFLSSGDLNEMEDVTVWCVPIKVLTKQGITSTHLLQKKSDQITFEYSKDNGNFYKLNADVTGCYRVCYNSEQLLSISDAIMQNLEHFSPADRIGIISDVIAFAQAGKTKTTDALEILGAFEKETNE
jgi:aminopeptidase 2